MRVCAYQGGQIEVRMGSMIWADSRNFSRHACNNGRVLSYDAAHRYHHRHFMGEVEGIDFPGL
jgi:hypothetical protein